MTKNLLHKSGRRHLLLLMGCLLLSVAAYAQQLSGVVTDSSTGEPLPGVNVLEKGSTNGTVTDANGSFVISLSGSNPVLLFSFIGYQTMEVVATGGQTNFNIALVQDVTALSEVVVVGYGVQKKSDITGAVASVKGSDIKKFATNSPAESLQGQIAGVSIRRASGSPRSPIEINIRGLRSIGGNGPLIIIDGIQGTLENINPEDIESIEVLKDGAAAAIYGSVAANGVVLVTTKSGKAGENKVEFNSFYGVDMVRKKLEFANTQQYLKIANAMAQNSGQTPDFLSQAWTTDTNWFDELYSNGAFQNYNLTFTGGGKDVNYMLSGGYNDRQGVLIDDKRNRKQVRSKLGLNKGIFSAETNIFYQETDDRAFQGGIFEAYESQPIVPLLDPTKPSGYGYADGFNDLPANSNAIGQNAFTQFTENSNYLVTNLVTSVTPVKNFKITGRVGVESTFGYQHFNEKPHQVNNRNSVTYHTVSETRFKNRNNLYELFANYDKQFGSHTLGITAGLSRQDLNTDFATASVIGRDANDAPVGFSNDDFETLNAGVGGTFSGSGTVTKAIRLSEFARVNYNFADRYFVQATVRRDRSSRFGPNNRVGYFPGVAVGWKISGESFFSIEAISLLKLRASYGLLGSESTLTPYGWQVTTSNRWNSNRPYLYPFGTGQSPVPAATFRNIENLDLGWEAAETINVGLDFGLMGDRLTGAFNYYTRTTNDMIIQFNTPGSVGADGPFVNFADVRNSGVELELSYKGRPTGEFNYSIGGIVGYNKNEITKLAKITDEYLGSETTLDGDPANRSRLNFPIGGFFVYEAQGIIRTAEELATYRVHQPNAELGDVKFRDVNNDGELNNDDLVFAGSGIPKFNLGVNFSATYKGFDLGMQWYAATGFNIYNTLRQNFEAMNNYRNYLASAADFWSPANPNSDVPRPVFGDPNLNARRNSTRFIEKGDYLRLRNVQIGYSLPASITKKMRLDRLRVYVSGQNLLTFTGYEGLDPEVGGALSAGTDFARVPYVKTILGGIQIQF